MNVTLFTSHCPKCDTLNKELIKLGIPYETFDDVDKMVEMGFTTMPMLKVDDKIMNYMEAAKWIKGGCKI